MKAKGGKEGQRVTWLTKNAGCTKEKDKTRASDEAEEKEGGPD